MATKTPKFTGTDEDFPFLGRLNKKRPAILKGRTIRAVRVSKTAINIMFVHTGAADSASEYLSLPRPIKMGLYKLGYKLKTAKERKAEGLPPLKWEKW